MPEDVHVVGDPAGAVYDPATATFDPDRAATRTAWHRTLSPKDFYIAYRAEAEVVGCWREACPSAITPVRPLDQHDAGRDQLLPHLELAEGQPSVPDPGSPPVTLLRRRPPSDPQQHRRYYALKGKADRVELTNPRQARALRNLARQLEELVDDEPARETLSLALPRTSPPPKALITLGRYPPPISHDRDQPGVSGGGAPKLVPPWMGPGLTMRGVRCRPGRRRTIRRRGTMCVQPLSAGRLV